MMKFTKTPSVEELQVVSRFESLRKMLLSGPYEPHLDKPLAYWALPTDRRLPLALMGRTLQELLGTPFLELSATPGIGQKKLRTFIKLLSRVANTDPAQLPVGATTELEVAPAAPADDNGFDPATISEVVWGQWRNTVLEHGLGDQPLGRFAPSLRNMTRVIWVAPLSAYAAMSLDEIRTLRTHGEKRVRAILEVFHGLNKVLAGMGTQEHLALRIAPRRIDAVESWVGQALQQPGVPGEQEILDRFVRPLLEQVRVDATRQIVSLAENRLGIGTPATSVRQAARVLGLTRARVYQLLNEVNDIMNVRWPLGRHQVYELRQKFQNEAAAQGCPPDLRQFQAAIELFYPSNRRGAAGPLATTGEHGEPSDAELSDDLEGIEEIQPSGAASGRAGSNGHGEARHFQTAN